MILCSRIDSILNRLNYQGLMRLKAKIVLIFIAIFIPLLLVSIIYNIAYYEFVFAGLTISIVLLFLTGLLFFIRDKWETFVNIAVLGSVAIAQFCYIFADYVALGHANFSYFYFGSVHSCVSLVLVGVVAVRLYQVFVAVLLAAVFVVYHFNFSYGFMSATLHDAAGMLSYLILSAGLSFLTFNLFRHHERLIDEKGKINDDLTRMTAVKDEFLANISHEMRNPLNALCGMAELLDRTELSDHQKIYVDNIRSCNKILLLLINNVLDINKIESSRYTVKNDLCNVSEVLLDISRIYESRRSPELSFCYQAIKTTDLWCVTDMQLITQIVVNLLDNAFKFTNTGHVMLVSNLSQEGERHSLLLEVSDSGIGMSPQVQSRIFDRFYQGATGYSKKFKGTGIGLSVVRDIVSMLRGSIEVKSKEGLGSVFLVSLPVTIVDAKPHVADNETSLINNMHISLPLRVYIAEDEPMNRLYLESIVRDIVEECRSFENGLQLCEAIDNCVPDLVLLDMQMPVMNGFECIDYIRKIEKKLGISIPLIATTGYSFPAEHEKIRETGVSIILDKPLTAADVRAAIAGFANERAV